MDDKRLFEALKREGECWHEPEDCPAGILPDCKHCGATSLWTDVIEMDSGGNKEQRIKELLDLNDELNRKNFELERKIDELIKYSPRSSKR